MNPIPECQHPSNGHPACSQWFHFKFQADNDGTVHAPIRITNDSLRGYCGRVKFTVKDHPGGTVLGVFVSGRYCIDGKGGDTNYHERTVNVDWTFKANPIVGQRGGDLYGVGMNEEYQDIGLNFGQIVGELVNGAKKLAEAYIAIGAPPLL
jgi:hypothetical protein